MKILIFLASLTLLLGSVRSMTVQLAEKDVVQNWQWVSSQLNEIDELSLADSDMSEDNLNKILSHEMPKLTKLGFSPQSQENSFYGNITTTLTPKLIKTIFKSKYFSNLKQLDLGGTNANDNWFSFLDNQTLNSSLSILKLNYLRLGKKGFSKLSKINFNGLLNVLQIDNTLLVEDQTVQSLAKIICKFDEKNVCSNQMQNLSMVETEIKRDGFIKLIKLLNSTSLLSLKLNSAFLHYNKTYKQGFNYTAYEVLANISFTNLEELQFGESGLNDEIAKILSSWKLPKLRKFLLMNNPITDQGFKAMVKKQNMPNLAILSIFGTEIKSQGFKHLRQQAYSLISLNFGQTKAIDKAFNQLKQMNLSSLKRLVMAGLYIKPTEFYTFLKEINCQNLTELIIADMNDLTDFLKEFPWNKYQKLQILTIQNIDISDGYEQLSKKNWPMLPNLKVITLAGTKLSFQVINPFIFALPSIFPQIKRITIGQNQNIYPISLRKLYTAPFQEGTLFNFYYIKLKKTKKLQVLFLIFYRYLLYDDTEDLVMDSVNKINDFFKLLAERVSFTNMKQTSFRNFQEFAYFKILIQVIKMKEFPNLRAFSVIPDLVSQNFFEFMEDVKLPNLKEVTFKLTIPGDVQESYIQSKIIPFFATMNKLDKLELSLNFLNENNGQEWRKKLIDQLNCPFLHSLDLSNQEMTVQDFTQLITKHAMTLKLLTVPGNFLQEGFFQLMARNQLILSSLSIEKIFFTAQEFAKFGKVSTEFLTYLQLRQNDLTDEHFMAMIQEKKPGPYFPNLQHLDIQENSVQKSGLDSWLETEMFNLKVFNNQRNYNPSFLNSLLKYPNKIKSIKAQSFDIYSLDSDLEPNSVHSVDSLDLKVYGFTLEDFKILQTLNFNHLQTSGLFLNNIEECEVLKSLLKINKHATFVVNSFKNDKMGLNSTCLQNIQYESNLIKAIIVDEHGTTYLPEYIELVTNTTRDIQQLVLQNTMLSPQSLKKILSKKLHSVQIINLQHNYLDDQTFLLVLNNSLEHLKYISLKSTLITTESIIALGLKQLPELVVIDFSENQLNVTAVQMLKNVAADIGSISLNGCYLKGDSLKVLREIQFKYLQQLELNYNQFTEQDIFQFLTSLQKKNVPKLKKISLKGISLSIPKYQIVEKIMKNKEIQTFQLDRPYNIHQSNAASI